MLSNLQFSSKIDPSQNMHTYYDINMFNNDQLTGNPTNSLVFNDSRNMPFLKSPSNYYVSIVRFSLMTATPSIPVIIPHVELGQPLPNKTIYVLSIYNIATTTQTSLNVEYIPVNTNLSVKPPLTEQDLSNEYYYVFSYQMWINMINKTLSQLATNAGIALPHPYFYFDVNTSLIKLYVPQSWFGAYEIWCNQRLYALLDSIPAIFSVNYYRLFSNPVSGLPTYYNPITIGPTNYYEISQETTSIGLMNPCVSIVFTTSLLPLNPNLTSPPQIFNSNSGLNSNGNNANITPIITDFQVNISNGSTYKNTVEYIPQAEYRLVDCLSDSPISSIQVEVFWKDVYGVLHPFRLASGCNCNLKLMFRRKDFNGV